LFFVLGVLFFVFFFQRIFLFTLLFLYFEEVFDEVLVEEKKRVGIIMSDRKLLLFFWDIKKFLIQKTTVSCCFFA